MKQHFVQFVVRFTRALLNDPEENQNTSSVNCLLTCLQLAIVDIRFA